MASFLFNIDDTVFLPDNNVYEIRLNEHIKFVYHQLGPIENVNFTHTHNLLPDNYYLNIGMEVREELEYFVRPVASRIFHCIETILVRENVNYYHRHRYHIKAVYPTRGIGFVRIQDAIHIQLHGNIFVQGNSEFASLEDEIDFFHIRTNNIVYNIKDDTFTKFSDINLTHSYPLSKSSGKVFLQADETYTPDNIALCLMKNNGAIETVERFPGSGEPEYASVRTKDYFIEHGVFQSYNLNYSANNPPAEGSNVTTITKNADSGGEINGYRKMSEMKSNKWSGYFPGGGYGFIGSIIIQNVLKVKDLILKYKLRLEE